MADLTISSCRQVEVIQQFTGPAVEAIAVGNACRFDATTGKITKRNATNAGEAARGGIAVHAAAIGEAVTIINQGTVDVGEGLAALNFGALVYLSDTDGSFADAAGTVTVAAGMVVPLWGSPTADRGLWLFGN